MTFNEEFMKQALKRVDELKQETIEKSKEIPGSEEYVRRRVSDFVEHSKCKRCHKILNVSELITNSNGIGMVCLDEEACKSRIKKANS